MATLADIQRLASQRSDAFREFGRDSDEFRRLNEQLERARREFDEQQRREATTPEDRARITRRIESESERVTREMEEVERDALDPDVEGALESPIDQPEFEADLDGDGVPDMPSTLQEEPEFVRRALDQGIAPPTLPDITDVRRLAELRSEALLRFGADSPEFRAFDERLERARVIVDLPDDALAGLPTPPSELSIGTPDDSVQLRSTGEFVDRDVYLNLTTDEQLELQQVGIETFNERRRESNDLAGVPEFPDISALEGLEEFRDQQVLRVPGGVALSREAFDIARALREGTSVDEIRAAGFSEVDIVSAQEFNESTVQAQTGELFLQSDLQRLPPRVQEEVLRQGSSFYELFAPVPTYQPDVERLEQQLLEAQRAVGRGDRFEYNRGPILGTTVYFDARQAVDQIQEDLENVRRTGGWTWTGEGMSPRDKFNRMVELGVIPSGDPVRRQRLEGLLKEARQAATEGRRFELDRGPILGKTIYLDANQAVDQIQRDLEVETDVPVFGGITPSGIVLHRPTQGQKVFQVGNLRVVSGTSEQAKQSAAETLTDYVNIPIQVYNSTVPEDSQIPLLTAGAISSGAIPMRTREFLSRTGRAGLVAAVLAVSVARAVEVTEEQNRSVAPSIPTFVQSVAISPAEPTIRGIPGEIQDPLAPPALTPPIIGVSGSEVLVPPDVGVGGEELVPPDVPGVDEPLTFPPTTFPPDAPPADTPPTDVPPIDPDAPVTLPRGVEEALAAIQRARERIADQEFASRQDRERALQREIQEEERRQAIARAGSGFVVGTPVSSLGAPSPRVVIPRTEPAPPIPRTDLPTPRTIVREGEFVPSLVGAADEEYLQGLLEEAIRRRAAVELGTTATSTRQAGWINQLRRNEALRKQILAEARRIALADPLPDPSVQQLTRAYPAAVTRLQNALQTQQQLATQQQIATGATPVEQIAVVPAETITEINAPVTIAISEAIATDVAESTRVGETELTATVELTRTAEATRTRTRTGRIPIPPPIPIPDDDKTTRKTTKLVPVAWFQANKWHIVQPPYNKVIYTTKRPIGAKIVRGAKSAERTLTKLGKGDVPANIRVDLGVVDAHIKDGKTIKFTGKGTVTDVGLSDPSPTKGVSANGRIRWKVVSKRDEFIVMTKRGSEPFAENDVYQTRADAIAAGIREFGQRNFAGRNIKDK